MQIHIHIHIHTHTRARTHTSTYFHSYIRTYIHTYIRTRIHTYTHAHTNTHCWQCCCSYCPGIVYVAAVHKEIHICIYIYIEIYTCVYTYMYIQLYLQRAAPTPVRRSHPRPCSTSMLATEGGEVAGAAQKHKDPTKHDFWYPLTLGFGTRMWDPSLYVVCPAPISTLPKFDMEAHSRLYMGVGLNYSSQKWGRSIKGPVL